MPEFDPSGVPDRIGPYRLIRRLGHGGSSQVFLGEVYGASGFQKRVAIKTLLPQFVGDPECERLFIREAKLGATLRHQNLVQVHDFGVDDGIQYMRLDLVDGCDLHAFAAGRAVPLAVALHIAGEVARALAYLHEATDEKGRTLGLVHRDLKPGNILISRSAEVFLGDFGILKALARKAVTRGAVSRGSYGYMSPEQVRNQPLTPASDQFALGCIVVELITGTRPFDAKTISEIGERIVAGDLAVLEDLPRDVATLCGTLLNIDPRGRFPDSHTLLAAFEALRSQHPFHAPAEVVLSRQTSG